jgi:hypothetical protein
MQFYKTTGKSHSVLPFNLFEMLGLENLNEDEKEKFQKRVTKLTIQYFLQEKVGSRMTDEEKEKLAERELKSIKDSEEMLEEVGDAVPNAAELFTEAIVETKIRLVKDHYTKKKNGYRRLLKKSEDPKEKDLIEKKLEECEANLEFIAQERWEMVASQSARNLSKVSKQQ